MQLPIRWSLGDVTCHAYKALRTESSPLHGHRHFLLTYILEGTATQTLNGKEIIFQPGDVFFLSPADFHKNTLSPGQSFTYYGVKFPYELLDERLAQHLPLRQLPLYLHLEPSVAQHVSHICAQLVEETEHAKFGASIYTQALLTQLILLILRQMPQETSVSTDGFLNQALGYLYSHFGEPITIADIAAYVGYTPNYFNARFVRHMGMPFGELLKSVRLEHARNLLSIQNLPVTDIAYECGFGSLSYFSRIFRKAYGLPPHKYRQEHVQKQSEVSE